MSCNTKFGTHTNVNDEACNNDRSIEAMEFGFKETEKLLAMVDMPEIVLLHSPEAKSPDTSQQLKHEQASKYKTDNPERLLCFRQAFPNTFVFATGVITDV